jgi:hypothetical protein
MILQVATNHILKLTTTSTADIHVHASWMDYSAGTVTPGLTNTPITTATTTNIVAAPAASTQRNTKSLHIRNKHASASNTVTLKHDDGTNIMELFAVTLLAGECLEYVEGQGFRVYDAAGQPKVGVLAVDPSQNGFRLTGVTGVPVMVTDSTSLSTIYLSPYKGASIALYDGTNWQLVNSAEVSLAVTGRTTDLPFDIFAFLSGGVVTLEFLDWSSATARATGLTRLNGVWTKTGDATRRYLGSCRARSATSFHWVLLGTDLPVKMDLWNVENRVEVSFNLQASTDTWAYTIATWRQAQGSANYQVEFMVGLEEDYMEATLITSSRNSTISIPRQCGIGYDVTNAISGSGWKTITAATANTVASIEASQIARLKLQPEIGRHLLAWLEISTATGTCTWVGDDGALRLQSGLSGSWNA